MWQLLSDLGNPLTGVVILEIIIFNYQNTTYISVIIISVLRILSYLILPAPLFDVGIPIMYNLNQETEAQRG